MINNQFQSERAFPVPNTHYYPQITPQSPQAGPHRQFQQTTPLNLPLNGKSLVPPAMTMRVTPMQSGNSSLTMSAPGAHQFSNDQNQYRNEPRQMQAIYGPRCSSYSSAPQMLPPAVPQKFVPAPRPDPKDHGENSGEHYSQRVCHLGNTAGAESPASDKLRLIGTPYCPQQSQMHNRTDGPAENPRHGELIEKMHFCAQELVLSRQRLQELQAKIIQFAALKQASAEGGEQNDRASALDENRMQA